MKQHGGVVVLMVLVGLMVHASGQAQPPPPPPPMSTAHNATASPNATSPVVPPSPGPTPPAATNQTTAPVPANATKPAPAPAPAPAPSGNMTGTGNVTGSGSGGRLHVSPSSSLLENIKNLPMASMLSSLLSLPQFKPLAELLAKPATGTGAAAAGPSAANATATDKDKDKKENTTGAAGAGAGAGGGGGAGRRFRVFQATASAAAGASANATTTTTTAPATPPPHAATPATPASPPLTSTSPNATIAPTPPATGNATATPPSPPASPPSTANASTSNATAAETGKELQMDASATGPFTVFVPTDTAINAMLAKEGLAGNASQLFPSLPEQRQLQVMAGVYYHILKSKMMLDDFKPGVEMHQTLLKDWRFVNLPKNQSQLMHVHTSAVGQQKKAVIEFGLDKHGRSKKANILVSDLLSNNGVIHIIDQVVEYPQKPSELLDEADVLDKFKDILKKMNMTNLMDTSSGITVFAPVNSAFNLFKDKDTDKSKTMNDTKPKDKDADKDKDKKDKSDDKEKEKEKDNELKKIESLIANLVLNGTFILHNTSIGTTIPVQPLDTKFASNASASATPTNATATSKTWKVTGSIDNWVVENVSVITHDVVIKNGILHVIDQIIGLPQPTLVKVVGTGASISNMTCGSLQCGSEDQCCDIVIDSPQFVTPRCYNPKTHVCASRGNFLCGKNAPLVCGLSCYNPNEYVCINSLLMCPVSAPLSCGMACFDPANYKCANGILAPLGAQDRQQPRC